MESRTKNRKTHQEIELLVARAFGDVGVADASITEFTAGWFNVTYGVRLGDGRDVVLKIAPPPDVPILGYEANVMSTEVATMQRLANHAVVPVPVIYFYDTSLDICDAEYFFMQRAIGKPLSEAKESMTAKELGRVEAQTGKIVRAINSYIGSYFGYPGNPELQGGDWPETFSLMFESLLKDGEAIGAQLVAPYDELHRLVSRHKGALSEVVSPRLVHWDLWDTNILIDDGSITGVIDFERALWADPLMEAQFRALRDEGVTQAMRSYGKTQFSESELCRCHLYSLYLGLVMCIESLYRGYASNDVSQMGSELVSGVLQRL